MKYEITKGNEKDFEGAPEWATECVWNDKAGESFSYWLNPKENKMLATWMNGSPDIWAGIYGHRNYIKAERRPISDPVWDGEGLPPVGVECEMENDRGTWLPVDVIAHKDGFAFGWSYGYRMVLHSDKTEGFRPIRSPEDVARDEAIDDLVETMIYFYGNPKGAESYRGLAVRIIEAIEIGKISRIKME